MRANQKRLFSVDLTRMGSTVLRSEEISKEIAGADQKIVITPSGNALLFQKCESLLDRRFIKSRDAFDIDVLLKKGPSLDHNHKAHLEDFLRMKELGSKSIRGRINRVDAKLCTAELRPVLPDRVFSALAERDLTPLRLSLEKVFADWL